MLDDNFRVIREILTILERSMDDSVLSSDTLSAKAFGVSETRFTAILVMMIEAGLIEGSKPNKNGQTRPFILHPEKLYITLKGLEYLRDNS